MYSLGPCFCNLLKSVSVEPAFFLSALSFTVFIMANDLGMYRVICEKYLYENEDVYSINETGIDCWDTKKSLGAGLTSNDTEWWKRVEISIQQRMASFSMISSMMVLLPSTIAGIILGAYSDRHGRKGVYLLSISGNVIVMAPLTIMFTAAKTTPLYLIYIINVIGGLTGLIGGIMTSSAAYLTDTVKAKDTLTVRMTILQICFTMAQVTGPLVANGFMTAFNYTCTVFVSIAIGCVAFVSAIFLVKSIKPKAPGSAMVSENAKEMEILKPHEDTVDMNGHCVESEKLASTNVDQEKDNVKGGCWEGVKEAITLTPHLLAESWKTVVKRRDGRKRAYLFVIAATSFITTAVDATFMGAVFTLYIQKDPISWAQDQISSYRSISNVIRLFGMAGGVLLFKKLFRMSDTLIIFIALASLTGQTILTAVASSSWVLYTAAGVGALSALLQPCIQSFVAQLVKPDEVGKAYGAFGLFGGLAFVFGIIGTGAIYQATVAVFPSLIFVICACMLGVGLILTIWLHLDSSCAAAGPQNVQIDDQRLSSEKMTE